MELISESLYIQSANCNLHKIGHLEENWHLKKLILFIIPVHKKLKKNINGYNFTKYNTWKAEIKVDICHKNLNFLNVLTHVTRHTLPQ